MTEIERQTIQKQIDRLKERVRFYEIAISQTEDQLANVENSRDDAIKELKELERKMNGIERT